MNYYEILEVQENASIEVIRMAYKAQVKKYHPDVSQGDEAVLNELMASINNAYKVLSNPVTRAEYDEYLKGRFRQSHTSENVSAAVGLKWFHFYVNIVLPLSVALNAFGIYADFKYYNINFFYIEGLPIFFSIVVYILARFNIFLTILCIYLFFSLRKFTPNSFLVNRVTLFLVTNSSVFMMIISNAVEKYIFPVALMIAIEIIYNLANIVYFEKRRSLFAKCSNMINTKQIMGLVAIMAICIVITAVIAHVTISALSSEDNNDNRRSTLESTDEVKTKNETIAKNFNKLAIHFGYDGYEDLINWVKEDSDVNLEEKSLKQQYEFIVTTYLGIDKYREVLGLENPFNSKIINSYNEYQKYVLEVVISTDKQQ